MKFLLILLFLVPQVDFASEFALPVPEMETLPNGLRVVWWLDDRLPLIDFSILVEAGSHHDLSGKRGTAELFAAAMDRAAKDMTDQEFNKSLEKLGVSHYVTVNEDLTSLGVHGLTSESEATFSVFENWVMHSHFTEADIQRERVRLLENRRSLEDSTELLLELIYRQMIFEEMGPSGGNHTSPQQLVQELGRLSQVDVDQFYKKHFLPKRTILTVIGRFNRRVLREKILKGFGNWQPLEGPIPEARNKTQPQPDSQSSKPGKLIKPFVNRNLQVLNPIVYLVHRSGSTQAQVKMGIPVPLMQDPRHYPLKIANAILGEMFKSRLNTKIRDQLGLSYSINSLVVFNKDSAEMEINSSTQNERVGHLIRKNIDVLKDFQQGEFSPEEIQAAKDYLVGGFAVGNSSLNEVAGRWLTGLVFRMEEGYLNNFIPNIMKVSLSDVKGAVQSAFQLEHLVIAVSGNAQSVRKSLEESNFKSIKLVSVKDLK